MSNVGHSLGGAMAVLAAYDIVDLFPWKSVQVYTVGAPRPGNQAFADKYDAKVPDTWHIINPMVSLCFACASWHVHCHSESHVK